MTILWSNNASTTVAGSIVSTDVTVTLASGTIFPHPLTAGDYFVATFYDQITKTLNEIVHVTNITGNVATIIRGQEGTTPLAWNSGDIFANLVTAGTLAAFPQQGAVPINTTDLYVGDDISTNPNHIVCNTIPVPAAYALGMVFAIRVKNNNTGPTDLALNGKPAVLAKRNNGSDLIGGNIVANQEYLFIWNGVFFQSTISNVPQQAPVTTFYIRSDSVSVVDSNGLESNSGFFNTTTDAFKTIQGAINTIKNRYISAVAITLRVADGTYTSGFSDDTQYIASWIIIGNVSTPANCILDCRSSSIPSYVPGATPGVCIYCGHVANMTVTGFTFKSYIENVLNRGKLILDTIHLNAPTNFQSVVNTQESGVTQFHNAFTFTATAPITQIFTCLSGGTQNFGATPSIGASIPFTLQMMGAYSISIGIFFSDYGGTTHIYDAVSSISGPVVTGRPYSVYRAGGINFENGNNAVFNSDCTLGGFIEPPSSTSCGGWRS
jgi:hypothetical protein